MSAWPEALIPGPSAASIEQTRPRYSAQNLWAPLDSPLIVNQTGITTSLFEVTVPIATNNEETIVPADAYRVTYRADIQMTAGTGSISFAILHHPGGAGAVGAYAYASAPLVSVSAPNIDINHGRLTYYTQITGSATYNLYIYVSSFDRIPS